MFTAYQEGKKYDNNKERYSMTQERFTIGDKTFLSNSWSPLKAAKNLPKIGKTFALPISFIYAAADDDEAARADKLQSAIPQAILMLFEQLEEQDCAILFKLILNDVWYCATDKQLDIDKDLTDIDELLQLLALVLRQHYGCLMMGKGKGFQSLFQIMVPLAQMTQD